jgi:hypothetical protein
MSWRAGADLFLEIFPIIQRHIRDRKFRAEFVRDLIDFFQGCDMDGTDLRRVHPEIEKAINELGVNEG